MLKGDSMKLYLVRHGASTGNTPGNLIGHSDHELTEAGVAQARAVAARLGPLGPLPVYCSDLPRARQTAEAITGVWGGRSAEGSAPAVRIHPDPRLREIDLGDYEGRSWGEFLQDAILGAAFEADPYNTPLPGGESLALVRRRVIAAVDEIVAAHGRPPAAPDRPADAGDAAAGSGATASARADAGVVEPAQGSGGVVAGRASAEASPANSSTVILVAHDGPIRAILNHFLAVPPEKWWTLSTTHGGLSLVEWSDGWVNVRFANDTSHLAGLAPSPPAV